MIRIFAAIRRMLALDKTARIIGALGSDFVKTYIIPRLNELAEKEKDPKEAERLRVLAEEYVPYTKQGTHEYVSLQNVSEAAIHSIATTRMLSFSEEEDLAQEVAQDFYMVRGEGTVIDQLKKIFKPEGARNKEAVTFTYMFKHIVDDHARTRARTIVDLRIKENVVNLERENEEGGSSGLENLPGRMGDIPGDPLRGMNEDQMMKAIKPGMDKFLRARFKNNMARDIYNEWWKAVSDEGGKKVVMKHDVYSKLLPVYGPKSEKSMTERWYEIKSDIRDYFHELWGRELTRHELSVMGLQASSVNIVAADEYVRRFAAWMLGF